MIPTVELILKHKKANMRKSEFLMLEALKSAPHLNDSAQCAEHKNQNRGLRSSPPPKPDILERPLIRS